MLPDITFEGGARNAQNLSAQKASASEGARLQKKNENAERKKRTEKKTRQRQKTSFLLIFQRISRIAGAFYPGTRRPDLAFTLSVAVFENFRADGEAAVRGFFAYPAGASEKA